MKEEGKGGGEVVGKRELVSARSFSQLSEGTLRQEARHAEQEEQAGEYATEGWLHPNVAASQIVQWNVY